MVMVEVPLPGAAIDVGLKVTVTPVGWPLALNATAESKEPVMALVMVEVPLLPCATVTDVGEAERLKLAGALTTWETVLLVLPLSLLSPE
jgi:hypothetical protein